MKKNWIFLLFIIIWSALIATFLEFTRFSAFKTMLNKSFNQPTPLTATIAFVVLGIILYYIFKGIELGKKQFSE